MANSRRFIYINLRNDIPAIKSCLEDKQLAHLKDPSDSRKKERSQQAKQMSGRIFNVNFLLTLAASADIYNLYGVIINVVQEVNILPYQRLSKFQHIYINFIVPEDIPLTMGDNNT